MTLELTALAMVIGIVLGIILAIMRMSPNPVVSTSAWLYTWFFRGTPVLVQLLFWYAFAYLFANISIGVPFGPRLHTWDTNSLITPFIAGVLGLGLNEAAYMSEIARAGLLSVDAGQHEAASALGMGRGLAMRRVILPQAMRVIIPPTGNETISMLKTTSLVITIGISDLLGSAQLDLQRQHVPADPAAGHRQHLVPDHDVDPVGRVSTSWRSATRGARRATPARPAQRLLQQLRAQRRDEAGRG